MPYMAILKLIFYLHSRVVIFLINTHKNLTYFLMQVLHTIEDKTNLKYTVWSISTTVNQDPEYKTVPKGLALHLLSSHDKHSFLTLFFLSSSKLNNIMCTFGVWLLLFTLQWLILCYINLTSICLWDSLTFLHGLHFNLLMATYYPIG